MRYALCLDIKDMEIYRLVGKLILLVAVVSVVAVVIVDSYMPDKFPVIDAAINSRIGKFGIGCALLCTSLYYSGFLMRMA